MLKTKTRTIALLAILVFIALLSYTYIKPLQTTITPSKKNPLIADGITAYMQGVHGVLYNEQGLVKWEINAETLLHNRETATTDATKPIVNIKLPAASWLITSNFGKILHDDNNRATLVNFYNQVVVNRYEDNIEIFKLKTKSLNFTPADDTITTQDMVDINYGNNKISGQGFVADLTSDEVSLTRNVSGNYATSN